jgi:acetyl-CoA acetyltransferase
VMTSAERARSLRKAPVYVLGAATCHDHSMISQMPDLATTAGAISGPAAFAQAGVKPGDVDLLMGYDSFTITQLLHFEDLGFCAKGEGPEFIRRHSFEANGSFPFNTSGGQLSVGQAGAAGGTLGLVEAIRQVTGQTIGAQVENARHALVSGYGMINFDRGLCSGAAILAAT